MYLANPCRTPAKLVFLGGVFLFTVSAYSLDGMATGAMATASAGGSGGGSMIELWLVLMLALLGAAQWLDHHEARLVEQRVRSVHAEVDHRPLDCS
jgi:uncharacterized membrane protein